MSTDMTGRDSVTEKDAETLVSHLLYLYRCIGYGDTKRGLFGAFEAHREEIIARLTAQPNATPKSRIPIREALEDDSR